MSLFSSHLRLPFLSTTFLTPFLTVFCHISDCPFKITSSLRLPCHNFLTSAFPLSTFLTPKTSFSLFYVTPQAVLSAQSSLFRLPFHCFSSHLRLSSLLRLLCHNLPHSSGFLSTVFPHISDCPFLISSLLRQPCHYFPHTSGCPLSNFSLLRLLFHYVSSYHRLSFQHNLTPQAALSLFSSLLRLSSQYSSLPVVFL